MRGAPSGLPLGALIYLNFFTNHFLPDLRFWLIGAVVLVFGRTRVAFTPLTKERRSPLPLAFVLIGIFVWFAENIATLFGARQYPHQRDGWSMVSLHKLSSWALLVIAGHMAIQPSRRSPAPWCATRHRSSVHSAGNQLGTGPSAFGPVRDGSVTQTTS